MTSTSVAVADGIETYDVVATHAGRRVKTTWGRGILEVAEVTRSCEPVRTAPFMASRMIALVEHPGEESRATARRPPSPATPGTRSVPF